MFMPAALTLTSATAASAASTTPATAGEIHLGLGGMCLDDTGGSAAAGTPVQIWKCLGNANQQWRFYPDGTLRPAAHPSVALSLDQANPTTNRRPIAVLATVNTTGPTADTWLPTATKGLADNHPSNGVDHPTYYYLNDPGGSTSNGTKLIGYPETGTPGANGQWTPPGSRYAVSKLTYRPDSGGGGDNWALDTIMRTSSVVWEGNDSSGAHVYAGAVSDTGTFVTVPGNLTPNQGGSDKGITLGDSTIGTMSGITAYNFTASQLAGNNAPPAAAQGVEPIGTSLWYELFFPAAGTTSTTTTFGGTGELSSGPLDWSWSYNIASDNCKKAEHWVDAQSNGGGQGANVTDITAPALASSGGSPHC
jgi:hypothetical protein